MILLDADILVLDIRYPRDARFAVNEQLLTMLQNHDISRGITLYALLEVIGILSFNLPTDQVQKLFSLLPMRSSPLWTCKQSTRLTVIGEAS